MHRKPPRRRNLWLALILCLAGILGYLAFRWSDIMTVGWFAPWPEAVAASLGTVVCFAGALTAGTTLLFGPLKRANTYVDTVYSRVADAPDRAEETGYMPACGTLYTPQDTTDEWLRGTLLSDARPRTFAETQLGDDTEPMLFTHAFRPLYGGYVTAPDDGRAFHTAGEIN